MLLAENNLNAFDDGDYREKWNIKASDKFHCNNFYNPIIKEMNIFIFLNKR